MRQQRFPDHGLEELLLVRKVKVDGALGHPRAGGDIVKAGTGKATLGKAVECRRDNLGRPGILAPLPAFDGLLIRLGLTHGRLLNGS